MVIKDVPVCACDRSIIYDVDLNSVDRIEPSRKLLVERISGDLPLRLAPSGQEDTVSIAAPI